MGKCNGETEFSVQEMNGDFIGRHADTYEQYVLAHSSAFAKIFGQKNSQGITDDEQMDGLLKISNGGCQKIYRRLRGASIEGLNADSIQIASRSIGRLGASKGTKVKVSKASEMEFHWHHPDAAVRNSYRISVVATAVSILAILLTIITLLF